MANHTVPTPRRPYQVDDTTVAYPITYYIAAQSMDIGAEIMVLPADIELPNPVSVSIHLHKDGSPCGTTSCSGDCDVPETTIRRGGTLRVGEWIWQVGRSWAVGWHRTNPSTVEKRLNARIDEIEEDLAGKTILHDLTRDDMRAITSQRDEALDWLAGAEKAHLDTRAALGNYRKAAWAAATVALVLAIALAWAVIA